jgi:hypothetical protein
MAVKTVTLRSPRPVLAALRENHPCHCFVCAFRRVMRSTTARLQARQTERGVALQVLVAGLAADAELLAQIGHAEAPTAGERDETNDLFHGSYLGPGHAPYV